ncbi:hypothetical protein, partial [Sporosarcina sp. E16_3]|uniref:hypothetical protein n=1 Tax=Sporosarcina sp. E16_3 TaxID=2789293 RepID=UPI001A920884
ISLQSDHIPAQAIISPCNPIISWRKRSYLLAIQSYPGASDHISPQSDHISLQSDHIPGRAII